MAEAFKVQDSARVIQMKRQHSVVSWAQFEPYWNQLLTSTNSSQGECARLIGYSSSSNASSWKKEDAVPTVALNAIRWVLHELKVEMPKPRETPAFSFEEAADLFAALRGLPIGDGRSKPLIRKLAAMLAQDDE